MPHKYATVEGVATYVHHAGRTTLPEVVPDLSQGTTVLCLHGSGGNGAVFDGVREILGAAHSPLAIDLPGHGRSAGIDSLGSIEAMARFVGAFLDKWGLAGPVLLGHSMGGAVALHLALERPEGVRGLVLCSSAARFDGAAIPAVTRVVEGKDRRPFFREAYGPEASKETLRWGFLEDLKTDPRVLLGDLLACREFDASEELAGISVPTLVVVGEADDLRAQSDLLEARIPGARLCVVPGAGHMLPLEQPAALADAIRDFLGGLS